MAGQQYELWVRPAALRSMRKLDRRVAERVKAAAEKLRDDLRPPGAKTLAGLHGVLRVRVAGDYRILYTVDDDRLVILVIDADHSEPIYRS